MEPLELKLKGYVNSVQVVLCSNSRVCANKPQPLQPLANYKGSVFTQSVDKFIKFQRCTHIDILL